MKTVTAESFGDYRISGSKFYYFLFPISALSDFELRLKELREKYYDANHHCNAYRIGIQQVSDFSSDDGEPSGTAGLPILHVLQSNDLVNVGCIVVRYFGGTKLGKSGLIDAYGKSAEACVQEASIKTLKLVQRFVLKYDYSHQSIIEKLKHTTDITTEESVYSEVVTEKVGVGLEDAEKFENYIAAKEYLGIQLEKGELGYILSN